jgi:O-succinylbenzoic acid--CoA ligase
MANNITCPISEHAVRHPEKPALITGKFTVNYREYDLRVRQTAFRLRELGLKRGERLTLLMDNSVEYAIVIMAAFRLGVVVCPFSTRFPPSLVRKQMIHIASGNLLATDEYKDRGISTVVRIDYNRLFDTGPAGCYDDDQIALDQPATILFTSGSSIPLVPDDCWLLSLPLYHVSGLAILMRAALSGAAVRFTGDTEDACTIMTDDRRITHLSLVSAQLQRLLKRVESIGQSLTHLKAILLGGSEIPGELILSASRHGWPIHKSYGLTEMASQVTTTGPGELPEKANTSGRVLRFREMSLSPDSELLVRGNTLFDGYVEGENIHRPFSDDGWFATGDLGQLDKHGYLTVTGRRDNLFVTGGENIQPEQVERSLCSLTGILQATVVPVPDKEFGFRPIAFLQTDEKTTIDEKLLKESLREFLPGHMIPLRFFPLPDIDTHLQLKSNRQELIALARSLCEKA